MKLFKKILIANRGEIAVRVIRSAAEMGVRTVAVYSKPDAEALHTLMADESYYLGEQELSDTYLNVAKIIEIAKRSGSDAIHPGYGFLAENPDLVNACEKEGIAFIGPSLRAIHLMGNKVEARAFVTDLGTPMTKGAVGTHAELIEAAKDIPLPILVKAAAGGGGKGMRIVHDLKDLEETIEATSREAKAYFGDEEVFIEQYILEPRHIELQIIGDKHGNVVHLYERECSIQRRYQKIIEESPSPTLDQATREKMGAAAVDIAKAIDYDNAGTIEFLVDKNLNFYFLEMNTRVQVEHPVTEMVTGIDIVREQILVAAGNKLGFEQADISQNGHAIEARIYAEDPENDFRPAPGDIIYYEEPEGVGIRVDSGIDRDSTIHSFFDPIVSKLIAYADNRTAAIAKLDTALQEFIVQGIKNNIPY
jgi:3-methylcrotonyl-CoA carboxylase alpha subunit